MDSQTATNHIRLTESDTVCDRRHVERDSLDAKHIEENKTHHKPDLQRIIHTESLLKSALPRSTAFI